MLGIVAAKPVYPDIGAMQKWIDDLGHGLEQGQRSAIYRVLRDAVPDFRGSA